MRMQDRSAVLSWPAAVAWAALVAGAPAARAAEVGAGRTGLWPLFAQSFDLFTIVLGLGSVWAVTLIVRCALELREGRIAPRATTARLRGLIEARRYDEAAAQADRDGSFVARVVSAAWAARGQGRGAMREAAELAASEQSARWFRAIEPLNVIGNLGPLVGLAGTVWGMVLAFSALGQAGGQVQPGDLAEGIAKALFHTLLGLCLAIPCLCVFGFYRTVVDRICTRAMVASAALVELLPDADAPRAPR